MSKHKTDPASAADKVGYCSPPKETQFQKGQSGNPKGRPKGTKNFATDLAEVLKEPIVIREGDKTRSVSKQRAAVMSLVTKALKGDARSLGLLLSAAERYLADQTDAREDGALSTFDAEVLKRFVEIQSGADQTPAQSRNGRPSDNSDAKNTTRKRRRLDRTKLKRTKKPKLAER